MPKTRLRIDLPRGRCTAKQVCFGRVPCVHDVYNGLTASPRASPSTIQARPPAGQPNNFLDQYLLLVNGKANQTTTRLGVPASSARRQCSAPPSRIRPSTARSSVAAPLRPRPSSAGRRQRARTLTGETREEPPRTRRSPIGQRRRPAAVPPRCRHAKKEYCVVIFSPRPSPNSSVSSSLSPPSVLPRIKRLLPRRVIFVVARKRDIGMNPMLCLFYLSVLVRLLTSQLVVVLVLLFRPRDQDVAHRAAGALPRSRRSA